MSQGAFLALLVFGLFAVSGVGALVLIGPMLKHDRLVRRRLNGLARHKRASTTKKEARLDKTGVPKGSLDDTIGRLMPQRQMLMTRLERAGSRLTLSQFLAITLAIFVAFTFIVKVVLGLGTLPGALVGAFVAIGIPHFIIGKMGKKRVAKFMLLLPDAIDLMVRALRSGLPVSEAIINAGHEVADPVGSEFRQVENGLKMGRELDDILWDTARRLDVPEFRFLVISMGIQRETGGNLADTLGTLSEMLRRRSQMKLKIKALSSEARSSALVLGLLPFFVVGALFVTSPGYIGRMFSDPRGLMMLGAGLLLMTIGGIVMAKIIDFDI